MVTDTDKFIPRRKSRYSYPPHGAAAAEGKVISSPARARGAPGKRSTTILGILFFLFILLLGLITQRHYYYYHQVSSSYEHLRTTTEQQHRKEGYHQQQHAFTASTAGSSSSSTWGAAGARAPGATTTIAGGASPGLADISYPTLPPTKSSSNSASRTTSATTTATTTTLDPSNSSRIVPFTSASCSQYLQHKNQKGLHAADLLASSSTINTNSTISSSSTAASASRILIQGGNYRSFEMHIYLENDIVSDAIQRYGTWEGNKLEAFYQIFTEYSKKHKIPFSKLTFVDIGANVGWFTFNLAALGVNVIAFEPMAENINMIQDSMCLEGNLKSGVSHRITLYRHGLGVRDESCIIYAHNINVGDGSVQCVANESAAHIPANYLIKGHIPIHRLDDVIATSGSNKHIVLLKMDTEGYEANVLQGGEELFLHGGIDVIVTEFVPEWILEKGGTVTPEMFMKKFYDAGYLVARDQYFMGGTRYMEYHEMMNMSNYHLGRDITLHSRAFRGTEN